MVRVVLAQPANVRTWRAGSTLRRVGEWTQMGVVLPPVIPPLMACIGAVTGPTPLTRALMPAAQMLEMVSTMPAQVGSLRLHVLCSSARAWLRGTTFRVRDQFLLTHAHQLFAIPALWGRTVPAAVELVRGRAFSALDAPLGNTVWGAAVCWKGFAKPVLRFFLGIGWTRCPAYHAIPQHVKMLRPLANISQPTAPRPTHVVLPHVLCVEITSTGLGVVGPVQGAARPASRVPLGRRELTVVVTRRGANAVLAMHASATISLPLSMWISRINRVIQGCAQTDQLASTSSQREGSIQRGARMRRVLGFQLTATGQAMVATLRSVRHLHVHRVQLDKSVLIAEAHSVGHVSSSLLHRNLPHHCPL